MSSTATRTRRPNTYAGTCSDCGTRVAAGAGHLGPKVNGRWTTQHTDCANNTPKASKGSYRATAPYRARRACITGGDCSSFSGVDCGGYDCDANA